MLDKDMILSTDNIGGGYMIIYHKNKSCSHPKYQGRGLGKLLLRKLMNGA